MNSKSTAEPEQSPLILTADALPIYGAEEVIIDDVVDVDTSLDAGEVYSMRNDDPASPVFQDALFALLFLLQLLILVFCSLFVAPEGYRQMDFNMTEVEEEMRFGDDFSDEDIQNFEDFVGQAMKFMSVYPSRIFLYIVIPSILAAFFIAILVTTFLIKPCTKLWTQISLVGTVVMTSAAMLSIAIAAGNAGMWILAILGIGLSFYFVSRVWDMIPFAAMNLKLGITSVSSSASMYGVALFFGILGFSWTMFWMYTIVGVFSNKYHECMEHHPELKIGVDDDEVCGPPFPVVLFFLISFYWTSSVIMNTVLVTVSGVTATWAYAREDAQHFCSPAVGSSLFRSLTYSFGSICLGSLLEAIVSAVRQIVETARREQEQSVDREGCVSIFYLILECFANCCEDLLQYFNSFTWCYVGIYGYSYVESGKLVFELFRERGWTTIITNGLVSYVLGLTSFVLAIVTGFIAVAAEHIATSTLGDASESYVFGDLPGYQGIAFLIGFIMGVCVTGLITNVLKGAVNTIIVCWADNPWSMKNNHPKLSRELAETWSAVFPSIQVEPHGMRW